MMQRIFQLDKQLFKLINYKWQNHFFDFLMPWLRNAEMWAPLYLFILLIITIHFRKSGWWWVAFFLITVIVSNFITSDILKQHIVRLRPCNDPAVAAWVRVLTGYKPMSYSFASSHAANHFGMAMFIYLTLKDKFGKWLWVFFLWAFSISYAQMYVGVHYPIDILGGIIIGCIVGYFTAKLFSTYFGLEEVSQQIASSK